MKLLHNRQMPNENFKRVGEHFVSYYYLTFTKELDMELNKKAQGIFVKQKKDKAGKVFNTSTVQKQIDDFVSYL